MSYSHETADMIVQQRSLRRRLSFWRVLAVLAVVAALVALLASFADGDRVRGAHVARYTVGGLITSDRSEAETLAEIAEDENVAALILDIDSPGGTTAGSEALYLALREVAAVKPVVSTVSNTAASGAYIAAMGSDHIVARGNAIVGSIGVIFQWPDATDLMETIGVDLRAVKSSPLKAEPDFTEPTPPAAIASLEAMVRDTQDWFTGLVAERRDVSDAQFDFVTSGRVFTGRRALELGLIDAIGGEEAARVWLETKGVDADLDVVDYADDEALGDVPWLRAIGASGLRAFGLGDAADLLLAIDPKSSPASLDGPLAVWHPSLTRRQ